MTGASAYDATVTRHRLARCSTHSISTGRNFWIKPRIAAQMVADRMRGERAAAGQRHGQQQLIGEMFGHAGAALQIHARLAGKPRRDFLGGNRALAVAGEGFDMVFMTDFQQQRVARAERRTHFAQMQGVGFQLQALGERLKLAFADAPRPIQTASPPRRSTAVRRVR